MKSNTDKWVDRVKLNNHKAQAQKNAAIKLTTSLTSIDEFHRMLRDSQGRKTLAIASSFMNSSTDYLRMLSKLNISISYHSPTTKRKSVMFTIKYLSGKVNKNNFVKSYGAFLSSMFDSFGVKIELSTPLDLEPNKCVTFVLSTDDISTMRSTISAKVLAVSKGKYTSHSSLETIMSKLSSTTTAPAKLPKTKVEPIVQSTTVDSKINELELQLEALKKQQLLERNELIQTELSLFLSKFNWATDSTKKLIAKYVKGKLA